MTSEQAKAHDQILAAYALIQDPARWTTCTSARDAAGDKISPYNPDAVCWCASGALKHVTPLSSDWPNEEMERHAKFLFKKIDYSVVNDGPDGHRAILMVMRRAILALDGLVPEEVA